MGADRVETDWRWFASPFELDGVLVTWPRALRELLVRPGPYAWLVDTLTPGPGETAVHVSRPVIELLSALPTRRVNLPEVASLLIGPISHSELAVACLMARYGPSPGATDGPMVLRPTKRTKLAADRPGDTGVLRSRYGDVLGDWLRSSSLTGILAGMGQLGDTQREETSRRALTAMMAPGAPELLAAAASANPITGNERGLDQLPSLAARELPEFMAMFACAMEDLRRLQEATARRPMSREEFLATLMGLTKAGPDAFLAEDCQRRHEAARAGSRSGRQGKGDVRPAGPPHSGVGQPGADRRRTDGEPGSGGRRDRSGQAREPIAPHRSESARRDGGPGRACAVPELSDPVNPLLDRRRGG